MGRSLALLAFVAVAASSQADVTYTLTPQPADNRVRVTIDLEAKGAETRLQMPRWSPGAYVLGTAARGVSDFKATNARGDALTVSTPDDTTWALTTTDGKGPSGKVRVSYSVSGVSSDGAVHVSGPSTYMYVVGRKAERCHLRLDLPDDWHVAVGLDAEAGGRNAYGAKSYDVLADNPITMGFFLEDHYLSAGKDHTVTLRGPAKVQVDRAHLIKAAKFVSDMETDFFGGVPYSKYVWHFSVMDRADGAGGLEHLSSTEISLASGVGPLAVGVLGHEFFHLWNVKRIRSRPLGPFDYTQLPQTGALWWLEGVTDYYAHLLLNRYGWFDGTEMREQIVRNLTRQRGRQARFEVSPYEASYRVRDAAGGRGNSDGFQVSYYDTGFLLGLCLDIEILSRTNGRRSLDDVERSLWRLCKDDKPGFEEGEIRKQLVRAGGAKLGEMYDQIVMKPGELPIEAQLEKVGLKLEKSLEIYADPGFTATAGTNEHGMVVRSITAPKLWPDLKTEDVIVEINGVAVNQGFGRDMSTAFKQATDKLKNGDVIRLRVVRMEGSSAVPHEMSAAMVSGTREIQKVVEIPDASPAAKHLRSVWLSKKRG